MNTHLVFCIIIVMTKYKKMFQEMLSAHADLFEAFDEIHALYVLDPDANQKRFNEEGEKILEVIREYEDRLCSRSQSTGYAAYTTRLAEKFQELVKSRYPKIDHVGVLIREAEAKEFTLKKISFS